MNQKISRDNLPDFPEIPAVRPEESSVHKTKSNTRASTGKQNVLNELIDYWESLSNVSSKRLSREVQSPKRQKLNATTLKEETKPDTRKAEAVSEKILQKSDEPVDMNLLEDFSDFEKSVVELTGDEMNAVLMQMEDTPDVITREDIYARPPSNENTPLLPRELIPNKESIQETKQAIHPMRKFKKYIPKMTSQDNEMFKNFADLLEHIKSKQNIKDVDKSLKIIQKSDGTFEIKEKTKSRLPKFLQKFFSSKRSKQSQEALENILSKINYAISAGQTHYIVDTELGPQKHELKALYQDFLNTQYAQQVIKYSHRLASQVATPFLREIDKNSGFSAPDGSWHSHQEFKEINTAFMQLLQANPYDGEKTLKFVMNLRNDVALSEMRKNLAQQERVTAELQTISEIPEKDTKQVNQLLKEMEKTEETFLSQVESLKKFLDDCVEKQLLGRKEKADLTQYWDTLISESKGLLEKLKSVNQENVSFEEKIKVYQEIYSPANIGRYLNNLSRIIPKTELLMKKIADIKRGQSGEELNRTREISDLAIKFTQRVAAHELFLGKMNQIVPTDQGARNFEFIQAYNTLIDLAAKRKI